MFHSKCPRISLCYRREYSHFLGKAYLLAQILSGSPHVDTGADSPCAGTDANTTLLTPDSSSEEAIPFQAYGDNFASIQSLVPIPASKVISREISVYSGPEVLDSHPAPYST